MSHPTVVLADDDPHVRRIGELSLRHAGFEVQVAKTGQEVLRMLEHLRVDVVVLDVMMPGLDGPKTFLRLRERCSVPVIFMTAKVQAQEVREYLALGANAVIGKPFDPLELPEQIRQVLQNP